MPDLLKLILIKIITITLLLVIINILFIFYFSDVFSTTNFAITIILINFFVIIDKIFQPLLLIGRKEKNFKQAFLLILFLFANPFLFAFPYFEYSIIEKSNFPETITFFLWVIGSVILIIGGIIMCAGRIILRKYSSLIITIEQNHKLVTNGPYSVIRHPIYAGIILMFFGYTLSFSSIIGTIIILAFFSIWFNKRIKLEEQLLIQTFGDKYLEYMKHTKRLVPFIY